MTADPVDILITRQALDATIADGMAALPNETGGILLGFRTPSLIVVTRTVTVADPQSSRCGYLRRYRQAQARMAVERGDAPPVVGYVGEWHTHPADIGPSRTDLRALAAIARLTQGPVALVVLANPARGLSHVHCRVAICQDIWPVAALNPVRIDEAEVAITEDAAASLEAEAEALTTRGSS
ncbi:Mov34/MPN/PAD-1 family protein [Micromonospora sp. MSM11]|nr:Mov34/MPN/PAD-1 family protein [Micromonospora sp. MSM11]MCL7455922.1 Mov34/MPN/PAD-1 family protein [Micromonospora sp. MSM11]